MSGRLPQGESSGCWQGTLGTRSRDKAAWLLPAEARRADSVVLPQGALAPAGSQGQQEFRVSQFCRVHASGKEGLVRLFPSQAQGGTWFTSPLQRWVSGGCISPHRPAVCRRVTPILVPSSHGALLCVSGFVLSRTPVPQDSGSSLTQWGPPLPFRTSAENLFPSKGMFQGTTG